MQNPTKPAIFIPVIGRWHSTTGMESDMSLGNIVTRMVKQLLQNNKINSLSRGPFR